MIKAIIFDFDGVIVESAEIKTEAFEELFSAYPQSLAEIINYHLANAGISRYVKFRYIYEQILKQALSKDKEEQLGLDFSQIVLQKIIPATLVVGVEEFLNKNKNSYQFFVASGTPEDELRNIVKLKGLVGHFKELHGSPKKKTDIINDIMRRYNFSKNEVVYLGDAQSDQISAREAQIPFIERKAPDLNSKSGGLSSWEIEDLSNLNQVLTKLEKTLKE